MHAIRAMHIRTTLKALLVMGALLTATGTAWALDACFRDSFGNVLVGKSFKMPRAGYCRPFNGYFMDQGYAVSGNACLTSIGDKYMFNLLTSAGTNVNFVYTF